MSIAVCVAPRNDHNDPWHNNAWQSVPSIRPEYERMCHYIRIIGEDFGIEFTDAELNSMRTIAISTEVIDRFYDCIENETIRHDFRNRIFAFLYDESTNDDFPAEVLTALKQLQALLTINSEKREAFIHTVEQIFQKTEIIRVTADVRILVAAALEEGALSGNLLVTTINTIPENFRAFIDLIASVGNLIDDLIDAREDYRDGERQQPPNFTFYAHGGRRALYGLWQIFLQYPKKMRVLHYFLKSLKVSFKYKRQRTINEC